MPPARDQLPDDIPVLKDTIIQNYYETEALKEEIKLLRAALYGRKSEKLPSDGNDQLTLDFGEEPTKPEESAAVEETPVKAHNRKKSGRKPLPEHLDVEEEIIDIAETEKQCACGCMKSRIGEETSDHLEHIPAKSYIKRIVRPKYACRKCEGTEDDGPTVSIAPVPEQIIPKSFATASLLAYILVSKFADALPFYRLSKMFQRNDIEISRGTICNWTIRVAALLKPMLENFKQNISEFSSVQADETGLQVLKEPGRKAKNKSFIWGFRGGSPDKPTILFSYNSSRAGKVPKSFLAGYSGYIQADGYNGYKFIDDEEKQIRVGCWAHARRKFIDSIKVAGKDAEPGVAHKAVQIIKNLYLIEKEAREQGFNFDEIKSLRQSKAKPILEDFKKQLKTWQTALPPKSLSGKAVKYTLNEWAALEKYIDDGRIQIDNNLMENAIRPIAVGRKNWLFSDTPEGAVASTTIYSIVETAKANGLEPYWYLRVLLKNLPQLKTADDFRPFSPQNIDKSLVQTEKEKYR
jgi:transposase